MCEFASRRSNCCVPRSQSDHFEFPQNYASTQLKFIFLLCFVVKELEKLAHEQDKETDKVALLKDADNQRKQLAR